MSEGWIRSLEKILDQIKNLEKVGEKDRLDHVRSMRFMLVALQRSLTGWMQWINNPGLMTRFSREDLEKMNKELSEFTRSFIEYDLELTKKGKEKGLKISRRVERRIREGGETFYI